MWRYERYQPRPINVATLPCESHNTENVILQREITKENCVKCNTTSPKWTSALNLLIWGVIQQRVHETIQVIDDLRKRLMQTRFDFDYSTLSMLRLTSGTIIWDHVCVLVVQTFNTCSDMNVHLCDASEYVIKLSMWFDPCNGYFLVNIKSWSCVHVHFGVSTFTR